MVSVVATPPMTTTPTSPVWADVEDPGDTPAIPDDALNSPRGEPVLPDTNFAEAAPQPVEAAGGGVLPSWATAGASDSETDSDEPDCHICRLTADEMGEPLVVVCACTGLPVHTSCLEAWRTQCANPSSAHRCPTCRERYQLPTSPRVADASDSASTDDNSNDAVEDMNVDLNWSRLELMRRRLVHQAGGETWLPPESFGPAAFKAARFALFCSVLWTVLILAFWIMREYFSESTGEHSAYHVLMRCATYSLWVSVTGYIAARFRSWGAVKLFIYFSGVEFMVVLVALMCQLMLSALGVLAFTSYLGWVYAVEVLVSVTTLILIIYLNPLHDELDPRRRRSQYQRRRRREARQRREREAAQGSSGAGGAPAESPARGMVVTGAVPQALPLRDFLTSCRLEAYFQTLSALGATSLEDLLAAEEPDLVAVGMRPLEVRRMKRTAEEHLQRVAQVQQGMPAVAVVGFQEPLREAATQGGLSAGLLGDVV